MSDQIIRSKWTIKLSLHESLHCFYSLFFLSECPGHRQEDCPACAAILSCLTGRSQHPRTDWASSMSGHPALTRCPGLPDGLPVHAQPHASRTGTLSAQNVRTEWTHRIALLPRSDGVLEHIADLHPAGLLHQRVFQPPARTQDGGNLLQDLCGKRAVGFIEHLTEHRFDLFFKGKGGLFFEQPPLGLQCLAFPSHGLFAFPAA